MLVSYVDPNWLVAYLLVNVLMLLGRNILSRVSSTLNMLLIVNSGSLLLGLHLGLVITMVNLLLDLVLLVDMLGRKDILVLDWLNGGVVVILVDLVVNLCVDLFVLVGLDIFVHDGCCLFLVDCGIIGGLDGSVNSPVESLGLIAGGSYLGLALVFQRNTCDDVLDRRGELAESVGRKFRSHCVII